MKISCHRGSLEISRFGRAQQSRPPMDNKKNATCARLLRPMPIHESCILRPVRLFPAPTKNVRKLCKINYLPIYSSTELAVDGCTVSVSFFHVQLTVSLAPFACTDYSHGQLLLGYILMQ